MRNINPALSNVLNEVRKMYDSIPDRFRKEASDAILMRVVAQLVPGLEAVDGSVDGHHDGQTHSWLVLKNYPEFIIDMMPRFYFPGPLVCDAVTKYRVSRVKTEEGNKLYSQEVIEIVDATEGAKRFLGMP